MKGPAGAPAGPAEWSPSCRDAALAERTTLGLGGPARWLGVAGSAAEVDAARRWALERRVPLLVLGGGSNLVVADAGFPGLALEVADREIEIGSGETDGRVHVRAGAAADWDDLVARSVAAGLAGVECLSGIPGRVGAAPIQNIGAYGQELAETLRAVEALDLETGERRRLGPAACRFGYRTSRFKHDEPGRWAVLGIELGLRPAALGTARYAELRRFLGLADGEEADLAAVRRAVLELRRGKSMVVDPGDPESSSVGSFFVNPVVSRERAGAVEAAVGVGAAKREMPAWPAGDGRVKLSAAWLIEAAGFRRGEGADGVGISERHALALVHRGGGTTAALVALAARIRREVRERFEVTLEPEPVFVGFGPPGSGPRGLGLGGRDVLERAEVGDAASGDTQGGTR